MSRTADCKLVLSLLHRAACTKPSVTRSKIDRTSFSLSFTVQAMTKKGLDQNAAAVVSELCRLLAMRGFVAVPSPAFGVGTAAKGAREKYQADVNAGVTIKPIPKPLSVDYIKELAEVLADSRKVSQLFALDNILVECVGGFGKVDVRLSWRTLTPLSKSAVIEAYEITTRFFSYLLVPTLIQARVVAGDIVAAPVTLYSAAPASLRETGGSSLVTVGSVLTFHSK